MTVHQAVRELREGLGQSQQKFATNLDISISGLANYERDRIPPVELLVKFASLARESEQKKVGDCLLGAIREQLTAAMKGQRIGFLSSGSKDEGGGLLLLSINNKEELSAAFDFFSAYAAIASDDEHEKKRGKRMFAALRQARTSEATK